MATRTPREPKQRTDLALPQRHISMSNALVRSAHGLSLAEKRILAIGLAKTDSVSGKDAIAAQRNEGWKIRLLASEYAETYEVSLDAAYQQLKDGGDHIFKRHISFTEETTKGPRVTKVNWCAKSVYHKGEGWMELAFNHEVATHLLSLREKFTTYRLSQVAKLRSVYTWRLFENLQSWKATGKWAVSVEDFCRAMEAPASCLKDFGNLRKRVIDPAIRELKLKDRLIVKCELEKAGRKITGLIFRFHADPQFHLDLEESS